MGFKYLELIKPSNRSEVLQKAPLILEEINKYYGKVANKQELKFLPSFILFVSCVVEEAYSNKKKLEYGKLDKKEEVLKHISQFLAVSLTENDKQVITAIIEDLHSSNRIKKVSYLSKTLFEISKFFLTKK